MPHAIVTTAAPKPNTGFEQTPLHLNKAASAVHASSGSGASILRTIVALIIVVGVIYGLTWIVRKLKSKDMPVSAGEGMERIASLPLGTNRSVALVRVGAELHLLGIAEQNVTPIRRFTEDEAIELGLPVTPPGSVIKARPDGAGAGGFGGIANFAATLETLKRRTQR